jgi:hypothetical protein
MKKQIKNRTITKARFLYLFVIFGGISMFVYGIGSFFIDSLPFWPAFTPVILALGYILGNFARKNIKSFWMFINDVEQGKLYIALTDMTHFSEQNKARLVGWVYPKRNQIRNETWLKLGEKVRNGIVLTKEEKKQARKTVVICPQQVLDGVSKAILVHTLIYAHKNICVLDDEVREILELTDENMEKFHIQDEIDKCRKEQYKKKYDRLLEIGLKNAMEGKA